MVQYTIRRLLSSIPVLIGIVVVVFALARLIPGDPCRAMLGEQATDVVCDRWNHEKGFDRPITAQFGIYVSELLQGNFGSSIRFSRPVTIILAERLPMTIELSLAALAIAIVVGVPAGIISAVRHNSPVDVGTMIAANIGVSMPVFWLGLMLAYLFSVVLGLLPPSGRVTAGISSIPFYQVWGLGLDRATPVYKVFEFFANLYVFNSLITGQWAALKDVLTHLILPSMALATIPLAIIARMTRSSLLDVLGQDYVRAAKAKGVPRRTVVLKHAFRNALLPVVTIIGLSLGSLLGGAVLTETVFGLAGVGRILFEAITARDYPIIQAFTLVIAAGVRRAEPAGGSVVHLPRPAHPSGVRPALTADTADAARLLPAEGIHGEPVSLWRTAWRRLFQRRSAVAGLVILGFLVATAILAPWIAPYDPNQVLIGIEPVDARQPPCIHLLGCPANQPQHLMGTDSNVRDLFSRVVYGTRYSLAIGFTAVGFAIVVGTLLGAFAGQVGGATDNIIMRIMDVLLAFPALLLAIAIVAVLGPGLTNALIAIGIVSIPIYARVMRASVLQHARDGFCLRLTRPGGQHRHHPVSGDPAQRPDPADRGWHSGHRHRHP